MHSSEQDWRLEEYIALSNLISQFNEPVRENFTLLVS